MLSQTPPSACDTLVPDAWRTGVESAVLLNGGAEVADWQKFADAQTGQLDKANDHLVASLGIVSRCLARDAAAVARATKRSKVLGIF